TNAVYQFCADVGPPFFPSKGWASFRAPKGTVQAGDHWALVKQDNRQRTRLVEFDSVYWRRRAHQRFITKSFDANGRRSDGSLALFICPEQGQFTRDRRAFCHQVVAEVWGVKKPGAKPGFLVRGSPNHFLDCAAGNCLAADIAGVRLIEMAKSPPRSVSL